VAFFSFVGCSHNPTIQKGCWITKKNNQNWINIYVLPFKAMVANYCLKKKYECYGIQIKNPFEEKKRFKF
jgi:hypothetical protein